MSPNISLAPSGERVLRTPLYRSGFVVGVGAASSPPAGVWGLICAVSLFCAVPAHAVAPSPPTGFEISAASGTGGASTRITLWWSSNTESDLKDYRVYRTTYSGVTTTGPSVSTITVLADGASHQDEGLTNESTYYYRLAARNTSSEESGLSIEVSTAPRQVSGGTAPAAPTGAGASSPGTGQRLNLSWAANTESDLRDYRVSRATLTGAVTAKKLLLRIVAPGTTHQDSALTDGATYFYQLIARDTALLGSAASTEVSAFPSDTQAPDTPAGIDVVDVPVDEGFAIRVSWGANTESDLKDYGVYRSTASGLIGSKALRTRVAAPGTTHQDGGLTNGTTYYYQFTARDVSLNENVPPAESSAIPYDNLAPSAPAGLTALDPGTTALNLFWTANPEPDLKDYGIYRATYTPVVVGAGLLTRPVAPGTTHQDGGLTVGLRYNYRVTARDVSLNESGGSTEISGVPGVPATPVGLGTADVPADGGTALNLSWTANTEADRKDYGVYRATWAGASPAPTPTRILAPGTTHRDSGLAAGTTYYYRLTARDASLNESGYSTEVSAFPVDNVPGAPAGVVAADVPVDQGFALRLSWAVNPDTDLKDYGVYRATTAGGVDAAPTRVMSPGTTHQASGLANGATYYFRLTARDLLNESGYSTEVSAVPYDNLAPTMPTGVGAADVPGDQGFALRLSWTANGESDLKDYGVYRATYSGAGVGATFMVARLVVPGTTHQEGGLTNGTTYYYRLTARDVSLNESGGGAESPAYPIDNLAPGAPVGLGAADAGVDNGDRLNLSWTTGTEPDLKDYGVYRATYSGAGVGATFLVARLVVPGATHQDTGLNPATTYYYRLTARDVGLNESPASAEAALKPTDELPPSVPGGVLAANPGIGRSLRLNWTPNTEADLKDYGIYRATFSGFGVGATFQVARVVTPGATHQDGGLVDGATYYFRLTSRDLGLNESGGSAQVSAFPTDTAAPATPAGPAVSNALGGANVGGRLTLTWTANSESDLKEYGVYRATWAGASPAPTPTRIASPGTTHQAGGLTNGTTYYFRLTARDLILNESGFSAEVSAYPADIVPPAAPTLISVLPTIAGERLNLVWTANTESDQKDYRVWRATYSPVGIGGAFSPAATIVAPGTTYQEGGLTNGTTYYYRLTARDATGNESPGSAELARVAGPDTVPPAAITSLAAAPASTDGFVRLTWLAVGGDGVFGIATGYQVWSASTAILTEAALATAAIVPQAWVPQTSGSSEDRIVGPFASGTTYYFAVKAYDQAQNLGTLSNVSGNSAPAQNFPPGAPAISAGTLNWGIRLTFVPPADQDLRSFVVLSGVSQGGPYIQVATVAAAATIYEDALTVIERRYYVVKAEDRTGYLSPFSSEATGKPEANLPVAPTDVKAAPGDAGTAISWRPPTRYSNGTPYGEKSGFRIERTPALTSPWVTAAEAAADAASWTDPSVGSFLYRVRALTGPKVPGPPSLAVSNQPGGATFAIGTDDQGRVAAVLEIGRDAADDLRVATNGRGQDVFIDVVRKPDLRTADVIEAFDFQPSLSGTGEPIARFRFRRPVAMKFYYQTDGNQISRLGVPVGQAATALAVYTHNGIEWVNLGGEVDPDRREVTAKTSRLSLYRLAKAARATEFRLVQVVPPKVFTPNGDGANDEVEFLYENPTGTTVTGKIFDAKGAQVADLRNGGRGTSLVWDGRDADGRPASGGVYLYQIEFDGKVAHGAIVLAR